MFFHFLVMGYVLLCIQYYFQSKEYSENSQLQTIDSNENLPLHYLKDPYLVQHKSIQYKPIFEDLQRYYIDDGSMVRLQDFHDLDSVTIRNNKKLIDDLNIESHIQTIYNSMKHSFSCNMKCHASILKGEFITKLSCNKHDRFVLGIVDGKCTIYIFHPKHKQDIQNKPIDDIKKWAIQVNLTKDEYLIIPIHWYYSIEYSDECIHYSITSDTVLSFWYPYIPF